MADQQHASSWAGDPTHMPDGHVASVTSLKGNAGLLGQNPGNATSRQDVPGSGELAVREEYRFQFQGEPGLLGQDTDDYGAAGLSDNDRQATPNPEFSGESGTKNQGQQGQPLDWNGVAPYKYGEFPKDSGTTAASKNPAPLT